MNAIQVFATGAAILLALLIALWLLSLALKNASIIDSFWGTGFVVVCWVYAALTPRAEGSRIPDTRGLLLGILVTIWGLRLSLHILRRTWGKSEDFRYRAWRMEYGPSWGWQSLPRVFLLQGALLLIISLPLLAGQSGTGPHGLTALDLLGVLVWAGGFIFEAGGDWQLERFKAQPANRGKVLDRGLWRYTRHPNYFGDAMQWWGFFLIAASTSWGWATFVSPALMTLLLVRVSGVALLEKTLKENRPGYRDYIAATSAFIPWFPKKKSGL